WLGHSMCPKCGVAILDVPTDRRTIGITPDLKTPGGLYRRAVALWARIERLQREPPPRPTGAVPACRQIADAGVCPSRFSYRYPTRARHAVAYSLEKTSA